MTSCQSLATKDELQVTKAGLQQFLTAALIGYVTKDAYQSVVADAKKAVEMAQGATSLAGSATDVAQSTASKTASLGTQIGRLASVATQAFSLATSVYVLAQGMVNDAKFQALEQRMKLFEQVYDAQVASTQRIIKELQNRTINSEVKANSASLRALEAIGTANVAIEKANDAIRETIKLQQELNRRIADLQAKNPQSTSIPASLDQRIRNLEKDLGAKASKQDLKELEARLSQQSQTTQGKNYDADIARIDKDINATNIRVNDTNNKINDLNAKINSILGQINSFVQQQIKPQEIPDLKNQVAELAAKLAVLTTLVNALPKVDLSGITQQISTLNRNIGQIPNNVRTALRADLGPIATNTTPEAMRTASASGVCRTLEPQGCLRRSFDDVGGSVGQVNNRMGDLVSRLFDGANLVANASQLGQLDRMERQITRVEAQNVETHTRLGDRIIGGISGWAGRLNRQLGIDRWLSLINTAVLLHNAAMLSNGVLQSLGYVIDNVLNIAGFQFENSNGEQIGFSSIVSTTIENMLKGVIGDDNYEEVKARWLAWSRVVRTASAVYSNVRDIFDTTRDTMNTIVENTGKIGNALKRNLVVPFGSFDWMPERNHHNNRIGRAIDNYVQGANATREVFDSISEVTEGVLEIQESAQELKENKEAAETALNTAREEFNSFDEQETIASRPPVINFSDLIQKEDEE